MHKKKMSPVFSPHPHSENKLPADFLNKRGHGSVFQLVELLV